jgi:Uncharacterized conserved protein
MSVQVDLVRARDTKRIVRAFLLCIWDLDDLVRYLVENYDHLDSDAKQLVPLKRVYWPA